MSVYFRRDIHLNVGGVFIENSQENTFIYGGDE